MLKPIFKLVSKRRINIESIYEIFCTKELVELIKRYNGEFEEIGVVGQRLYCILIIGRERVVLFIKKINSSDNNHNYYKRYNDLFFSYINNRYEQNNIICKEVILIIYNNFVNNPNLYIKIRRLFSNGSETESCPDIDMVYIKKKFDLGYICGFLSSYDKYEVLAARIKELILKIYAGEKRYILKVYPVNKQKDCWHFLEYIEVYKKISRQVNMPKIIKYQLAPGKFAGENNFLILYQYVDGNFVNITNYNKLPGVCEQIIKLHNCKLDSNRNFKLKQMKFIAQCLKSEKNAALRKIVEKQYLIVKNDKTLGWCHNDLKCEHFIEFKSWKPIYIIDFDEISYDDIYLDLGTLINNLLIEKADDFASNFMNIYFKNSQVRLDKNKLFAASLLAAYRDACKSNDKSLFKGRYKLINKYFLRNN